MVGWGAPSDGAVAPEAVSGLGRLDQRLPALEE
jgi:hypothetical protein